MLGISLFRYRYVIIFLFIVSISLGVDWNFSNSIMANFDETLFLNAAKNLANFDRYAVSTTYGFNDFWIHLSTGPTVILPAAFIFKFFGVSLTNARLVVVAYQISFLLACYWFFKKANNIWIFMIGYFLVFTTFEFFDFSNSVFGELPAVSLLLWGIIFWSKGISLFHRRRSFSYLILSGIFFGLSILTKNIFGLALISLVATVFLTRFSKDSKMKSSITDLFVTLLSSLVPFLCWFAYRTYLVGLQENLANLKDSFLMATIGTYSSQLIPEKNSILQNLSAHFIDYPPWVFILIIGTIAYGFIRLRKSKYIQTNTILLIFIVLVFALWIPNNLYARHLEPVLLLLPIFALDIITTIFNMIKKKENEQSDSNIPPISKDKKTRTVFLILILVITLSFSFPGLNNDFDSQSYQYSTLALKSQLAAAYYIQNSIPHDATLCGVGWYMNWDLSFLTNRPFCELSTLNFLKNEPHPIYFVLDKYDAPDRETILNSMGSWINILNNDSVIEKSFGEIEIYKIKSFDIMKLNPPIVYEKRENQNTSVILNTNQEENSEIQVMGNKNWAGIVFNVSDLKPSTLYLVTVEAKSNPSGVILGFNNLAYTDYTLRTLASYKVEQNWNTYSALLYTCDSCNSGSIGLYLSTYPTNLLMPQDGKLLLKNFAIHEMMSRP